MMSKPEFQPESGVTRREFFEWLHACPADWYFVEDQASETTIRFEYHEESEEEDYD